jgi:hypothetical protein
MLGLGVVLAPWLFTVSASAVVDETYAITHVIDVPLTAANTGTPGNPPIPPGLTSTDIAFVDPVAGVYVLADRSNAVIDVIDTRTNTVIHQWPAGFAGPGTSGNGGPNGVLIADSTFIWAGDANGLVKVLNLYTGALVAPPIYVGGSRRADELCFDPVDHIVLVGSPSETTGSKRFITFIDSNTYQILGKIVMDTVGVGPFPPGHGPLASGGIEQCQYNQRDGKFYINLPGANGTDGTPPTAGPHALVLQIDPVSETILNTVDVYSTGCTANNGMAIGPGDQIGIGCSGAGTTSVIISEKTLTVEATLPNTATDEMWFNPGDNHYFFGNAAHLVDGPGSAHAPQLGVVDALGETGTGAPALDFYPASAEGSTTVAVDPNGNQAYVVIKNTLAAQPYKICSTFSRGSIPDTRGCIAVYTPTGPRDPGLRVIRQSRPLLP